MKKLLIITAMLFLGYSANCQSVSKDGSYYYIGSQIYNPPLASLKAINTDYKKAFTSDIPILAGSSFMLSSRFSVGVEYSYCHARGIFTDKNSNTTDINVNFHRFLFDIDFHWLRHSENHDLYSGFGLGYNIVSAKAVSTNNENFAISGSNFGARLNIIGWRWLFIKQKFGSIIEFSDYLRIGFTGKF